MNQEVRDIISCSICFELPADAVECCQCSNMFCLQCIVAWFDLSRNYVCPHRCLFGSIRAVSGVLKRIIARLNEKKDPDTMDIVPVKKIDWEPLLLNFENVQEIQPCLALFYLHTNKII